ncbi:MAG TPA: extracellular solute-binding protein [Pseudolabrys sp.]|uniref:ABC transporter substrate-binding protein n=1 Tax=Pseudolabrys sp. TaxID=1960880 RepID=UPI002DDD9248|nr:extracellular solute-binding protein [Pseudolabrys sp.]HEV2627574.1 extracellular solute-binding protein [Pseudolabrys sp.]
MKTILRCAVPLLAVAGIVALTPAAMAQSSQEKQLYEAAKKEGQLTWYSGVLNQQICDEVGQAFSKKFPGVSVHTIKTTSQVAFQRLLQDIKAGDVLSDVFTTTDESHVAYLEKKDLLTKYVPENEKGMSKVLRGLDPNGYYHVSWVGIVALVYNKSKVSAADAPKDWPDLTNPKWKNQIGFGSPNYSGLIGVWTVAMQNAYGWDYFEKLNKLNPLIGRSVDDPITTLNSGERQVAPGNPASAFRSAARGNPLAVNYPTSGTLIDPSPSAILKGAHHPNAAKLFMEFLAGPEYSKILAKNFEQPLRDDVPPPPGAKSLSDMKVLSPKLADIEKELPKIKEKWRDTFGN